MKRVITFVLLIVCLFGLVPSTYASGLSKFEIADFLEEQFSKSDIFGIESVVAYYPNNDSFYIIFESDDVLVEAFYASIGEESAWELLKQLAYSAVELAKSYIDLFDYGNSDIRFAYGCADDNDELSVFYTLDLIDGTYIVYDELTGDTEPVIDKNE